MAAEPNAHAGAQRRLSTEQVESFHHDVFVEDQLQHFQSLVQPANAPLRVIDVGGGCGFFARALTLRHPGVSASVIDMDADSVAACRSASIEALQGDALAPPAALEAEVACFNLILHHMVTGSERTTRELQMHALKVWGVRAPRIFVNEYIYESHVAGASGWLIFAITRSPVLSAIGRVISSLVPSLRANTFGVGVRFRSHAEWLTLFNEAGFDVVSVLRGPSEGVSPARRLLLIQTIRRDSFVLRQRQGLRT